MSLSDYCITIIANYVIYIWFTKRNHIIWIISIYNNPILIILDSLESSRWAESNGICFIQFGLVDQKLWILFCFSLCFTGQQYTDFFSRSSVN